jgi:hypothetical protein
MLLLFWQVFQRSSCSSISEEHVMGPFMSVCVSRFSYDLGHPHDSESFMKNIVATVGTEVFVGTYGRGTIRTEEAVGTHCYATMETHVCGSRNRHHCWNTWLRWC